MVESNPQQRRQRLRASVGVGYRWWWHVSFIASAVLAFAIVSASAIEDLRWWEWLSVVPILIAILFGEWGSHRFTMHRKVFPRAVYRRHAVQHHAFFTFDEMMIDSADDLRWVLFPPWAVVLLVASVMPLFLLLYFGATPNIAWVFSLVVVVYYGFYEITHVLAHVQLPGSLASRAIANVSWHHRVHHDPALMQRWNFNFVIPLFDWMMGTLYSAGDLPPPTDD